MIDVEAFLSGTTTEANATTAEPVPAGEYVALLERVDKPRQQGEYVVWDLHWTIDDEALRTALGRKKITSRQSLFLDLTPSGNLDTGKGKNVQLGRLREALGQNTPGVAWSPSMMVGKAARIKVGQRSDNEGILRDRVEGVSALS